jgi:glutamine amidotransferase
VISIIDYGCGNLRSVQKSLEQAGAPAIEITNDPARISRADALILPGVGAFRDAMRRLKSSGLAAALIDAARAGVPLLGICLGMQLLLEESAEYGRHAGLGLIPGVCVRFDEETQQVKVPQVGWNTVQARGGRGVAGRHASALFAGIPDHSWFYFVHSYYCVPADPDAVLATTCYGADFCCALGSPDPRLRVWGVQFHPEKSSAAGLQLLRNFIGVE